jgi:hypothetical protein
MNLYKKWLQHLKENNMTYIEHLIFALYYGILCLYAGFTLVIHSILPCFYKTTGSDLVTKMSRRFKRRNEIDDT